MSTDLPITQNDRETPVYSATAGQTAFTVDFPFQEPEDLRVALVDTSTPPVETTVFVLNTHYTVTGAGSPSGGTVTFLTGRTAGDLIRITGDAAVARTTAITQNGKFRSLAFEYWLDRVTIWSQERKRDLGKVIGASALAVAAAAAAVAAQTAAENAAASVGSVAYNFTSVAALKASTAVSVGAGAEWRAQGFRYIEAASGATDHHLTTAAGVKLYVTEYNPVAFGALGDGSTNDATELLAWANAVIADATAARPITAVVPRGYTFLTGTTIPIGSNVTFTGGGIIAAHSTLPETSLIMGSATLTAGAGNFANSNVHLHNITIDGRDRVLTEAGTTQNLVRLYSTDRLSVKDCVFLNAPRGQLVLMGCTNYEISGNHFNDWGFTNPTALTGDGGSAVFVGKNYVDDTDGGQGLIANNTFRNGMWTAISCYVDDTGIIGNTITNGMECGIFIRRDAGGGMCRNINCSANTINGIRENYVDAAGIVMSAENSLCNANNINDTDAFGISIGKAKNLTVDSNIVQDAVRLPATYPQGGAITLRSTDDAEKPVGVYITNNTIRDTASPRIAPNGIAVYHVGTTPVALTDIVITGNNAALSCAAGGNPIFFETALRGNFCQVGNNIGGLIRVGTQAIQIIYNQSANIDLPAIAAGAAHVVDVAVPSAILAITDKVVIGLPADGFDNRLTPSAFVLNASTIRLKVVNGSTTTAADAVAKTTTFTVFR